MNLSEFLHVCIYVCVPHVCLERPEEVIGFPGTIVIDVCERLCDFCELNLDALGRSQYLVVILTLFQISLFFLLVFLFCFVLFF